MSGRVLALRSHQLALRLSTIVCLRRRKARPITKVLKQFNEVVCRDGGGVAKYLRIKMATPESKVAFCNLLFSSFPAARKVIDRQWWMDNIPTYKYDEVGKHAPIILHPALFSFLKVASARPEPANVTCQLLADEMLSDKFATQAEPLLLKLLPTRELAGVQPLWTSLCEGKEGKILSYQSVGFRKGQARVLTMLALCHLFYVDGGIDVIRHEFSGFFQSLSDIHAHVLEPTALQNEVILNFMLSSRGSIRKPPNTLTWVSTLKNLRDQAGFSDLTALRKNSTRESTRSYSLSDKRQCAAYCQCLSGACRRPVGGSCGRDWLGESLRERGYPWQQENDPGMGQQIAHQGMDPTRNGHARKHASRLSESNQGASTTSIGGQKAPTKTNDGTTV